MAGRLLEALPGLFPGTDVVGFSRSECDLLSAASVEKALGHVGPGDVLVMPAAIARSTENSYRSMLQNIEMAHHVADLALRQGVDQVVFFSSIDVYGCEKKNDAEPAELVSEMSPLTPDDFYSISKMAGESILRNVLREKGIPLSVLRLPGIYGRGDGGRSLVGMFIKQACEKNEICLFGEGRELRNYIYADDLVRVVAAVIRVRMNGVVNVVSPQSYAVREIADMVRGVVAPGCRILFKEKPVLRASRGSSGSRGKDIVCHDQRLRELFPDLGMHDLSGGIKEYWRELRQEKEAL